MSIHTHTARKRYRSALVLGVGLAGPALPTFARADLHHDVAGELTSDYVYRQYSKSAGAPAARLNVNLAANSEYFGGLWVSAVNFTAARVELNPYVGRIFRLDENWRINAAAEGYIFDRAVFGRHADYGEVYAQLQYRDLVTARVGLAIAAYGSRQQIPSVEITRRYQITDICDLTGGIGYEGGSAAVRYDAAYWNVKLTYFLDPHLAFGVAYYGARHLHEHAPEAANEQFNEVVIGDRAVVSVSFGF